MSTPSERLLQDGGTEPALDGVATVSGAQDSVSSSEEDEPPIPNSDDIIKPFQMHPVVDLMRTMTPAELISRLEKRGEYIGSPDAKGRLDGATLDDRGRFMTVPEGEGVPEELRWSYAAKGRSAGAFVNGKSGNACPPQWATRATCPSTITIGPSSYNKNMVTKRAVEKGDVYNCNVFDNAQSWQQWTISCSLPPASTAVDRHLREGLTVIATRAKALNNAVLGTSSGGTTRYQWSDSTFGGDTFFPRAERALLVRGGEEMDPGRLSAREDHRDLLKTVGEERGLRYIAIPEATVLDTVNKHWYKFDWHFAHVLPSTTLWEVGFFIRLYKSPARGSKPGRMGLTFILESLVAHGKCPTQNLISPPPVKRKYDFFAAEVEDEDLGSLAPQLVLKAALAP